MGFGRVAVIDASQIPGTPIAIGDHVRIGNIRYEVLGIETSRKLIAPPVTNPHVGFLVQRVPYQCGTCGQRYAVVDKHRCPPDGGATCDVMLADWCHLCRSSFMPGKHVCA
ncbi:ABC transporter permease [Mycobacterium hackensackense]|uniref:ABC transporter permease n=1 Tax=Mycobacterium hackensackense TaxID=228909 RepID=UPI0022659EB8|nr:ABC transporter permease [Mycobacterium hackensackense]MCV7255319.1 ABC transporter permease [Mycobacterium hackensackense]